jgi:hypothetical protein
MDKRMKLIWASLLASSVLHAGCYLYTSSAGTSEAAARSRTLSDSRVALRFVVGVENGYRNVEPKSELRSVGNASSLQSSESTAVPSQPPVPINAPAANGGIFVRQNPQNETQAASELQLAPVFAFSSQNEVTVPDRNESDFKLLAHIYLSAEQLDTTAQPRDVEAFGLALSKVLPQAPQLKLEFFIDAEGRIVNLALLESANSTIPNVDIAELGQILFHPAMRQGRPSPSRKVIEIVRSGFERSNLGLQQ